jgi:hypothetical protein
MVGIPLHQEVPIELQMEEVILRLNQKHYMLSGVHLQEIMVILLSQLLLNVLEVDILY